MPLSLPKNEGPLDRVVRAVAGVALVAVALVWLTGILQIVVAIIGVITLITAATGFCALYKLLGIHTGNRTAPPPASPTVPPTF